MKFKMKKGDLVAVIAGKDKGKQGKVLEVLVAKARVRVEGVNRVKRHTKPSQKSPQGGILEKEAAIHVSNVMLVDPKTNKGGRVKIVAGKGKDGAKTRVFKKTGTELKA
jgi:large subunit ribosomal protein L24